MTPQEVAEARLCGEIVLIRDNLAGIYVGVLDAIDVAEHTVVLRDARQVWRFAGAAATPGIAARGLDHEESRVGPVVECIALGDVVAAILCTPEGAASVFSAPVWAP